ncbi:type IX secretion system plug protein domain-containing protein [uncultured Imperialibacter sp.]
MQPPIVHISQPSALTLKFDEILSDFQQYNAYIVHCNFNWERSALTDMEFLNEYNSYPVNNYQYSQSTIVPYTQYSLELPRVKKSGNYVVVVYRGTNKSDIILSRRFMVFEGGADIQMEVRISSSVAEREENHQVEFSVNYGGLTSTNAYNDFKVMVRQNRRWDNAILNLKPTLVREDQSYMEYRNFTLQNNFKSTREFRFFDIRSLSYNGRNVGKIEKSQNEIRALLLKDASRFSEPYSRMQDLDGNFFIGSTEPNTSDLQTDYVKVMFFLETEKVEATEVYVIGGFNDWQKTPQNRLVYDDLSGMYTASLLLKQGFYNYMYWAKGNDIDPYMFEGYNFQAENEYEVFVYFKTPGSFVDRLVGYQSIIHNGPKN